MARTVARPTAPVLTVPRPGASSITVFHADEHEVARIGVRSLLADTPHIDLVGEAGTIRGALTGVARSAPDVVVLGSRFPDGDGLELCRRLRSESPAVRCVVLASAEGSEGERTAREAGAAAYVLKREPGGALVAAVREAFVGGSEWSASPRVPARVRTPRSADPRFDALSGRERLILDLMGEGGTNVEIGVRLGLAEKTVRNYVSAILAKLGARNRTDAVIQHARYLEGLAPR